MSPICILLVKPITLLLQLFFWVTWLTFLFLVARKNCIALVYFGFFRHWLSSFFLAQPTRKAYYFLSLSYAHLFADFFPRSLSLHSKSNYFSSFSLHGGQFYHYFHAILFTIYYWLILNSIFNTLTKEQWKGSVIFVDLLPSLPAESKYKIRCTYFD